VKLISYIPVHVITNRGAHWENENWKHKDKLCMWFLSGCRVLLMLCLCISGYGWKVWSHSYFLELHRGILSRPRRDRAMEHKYVYFGLASTLNLGHIQIVRYPDYPVTQVHIPQLPILHIRSDAPEPATSWMQLPMRSSLPQSPFWLFQMTKFDTAILTRSPQIGHLYSALNSNKLGETKHWTQFPVVPIIQSLWFIYNVNTAPTKQTYGYIFNFISIQYWVTRDAWRTFSPVWWK